MLCSNDIPWGRNLRSGGAVPGGLEVYVPLRAGRKAHGGAEGLTRILGGDV
jgi:hypothetical protein